MICHGFDLLMRNIDVSVFQQLSSDKCEFDSFCKQTLSGGSQMPKQMEKHTKNFRNNRLITFPLAAFFC